MEMTNSQVPPQRGHTSKDDQKQEKTQPQQTLPEQLSPCRRNLALVMCFIECLLFGGTLFGWSSLVYVLKLDGIYSNLCSYEQASSNFTINNSTENSSTSNPSMGCQSQDEQFSLAYTIGITMLGLSSFPMGMFFDRFGLLPTKFACCVFALLGYLPLAFANKETSWLIFPGSACLAVACVLLILTNSHAAQLDIKHVAIITAIYNGAVSTSSAVMLLVKLCHDSGLARVYSMSFICGLLVVVVSINALFILPKYKAISPSEPKPIDENENLSWRTKSSQGSPIVRLTRITDISPATTVHVSEEKEDCKKVRHDVEDAEDVGSFGSNAKRRNKENVQTSGINGGIDNTAFVRDEQAVDGLKKKDIMQVSKDTGVVTVKEDSLVGFMFTVLYITYIFWFACRHVAMMAFLGSFNMRATDIANGDIKKVSLYTNVLAYAQLCAFLLAPPAGLLIDWRRKAMIKQGVKGRGMAMAAFLSMLVIEIAGITMMAAVLTHTETGLYVATAASEVFRSSLYSTAIAFLAVTWPPQYFGALFGLAYLVNGLGTVLQYPYTIWIQTYSFFPVDIFILGTCVATLVLPFYITIKHFTGNSQRD